MQLTPPPTSNSANIWDILPWLKGMARNLSLNFFRGEKRRNLHQQAAAAEILDRTESFTDRIDDTGELSSALNDCLESMPERNRRMVNLRYRDNLNSQRIAEELEATSEAIRMGLMRIRAALRECIENKLGGEVAV